MNISSDSQFYCDHKLWGVRSLHFADRFLKPHNMKIVNDLAGKTFEVINSQNIMPNQLYPLIYLNGVDDSQYDCCFPHIDSIRTEQGNLKIVFKKQKPAVPPLLLPAGLLSNLFGCSLPDDPKMAKKAFGIQSLDIPTEKLEEIQQKICKSFIETMSQIMSKKEELEGLWYPNDYRKLNPQMPAGWRKGHANEKYFKRIGRFNFELLPSVKPSDGIRSFLKGPTTGDCGNALVICCYKAILDIVDEKIFDQFFDDPNSPLKITQVCIDPNSPLSYFCRYTKNANQMNAGIEGRRPIKVGDMCGFKGVGIYTDKHPDGFGGAWNVIYMGLNEKQEQVYLGHGFSKPMTEKEILQLLLDEYNLERTEGDLQVIQKKNKPEVFSPEQNENLKNHYTIPKYLLEHHVFGFAASLVKCLDPKYIYMLQNTTDVVKLQKELRLRREFSSFKIKPGIHRRFS
jgi:Protein-glutamine gamma-glutamyltransferase